MNTTEPIGYDEFIEKETRRKIAKCLDSLGSRFPQHAQETVKSCFWEVSDALKLIDECDSEYDDCVQSEVNLGLSKCIEELGGSISQSEIRTVKHWFNLLASDITGV